MWPSWWRSRWTPPGPVRRLLDDAGLPEVGLDLLGHRSGRVVGGLQLLLGDAPLLGPVDHLVLLAHGHARCIGGVVLVVLGHGAPPLREEPGPWSGAPRASTPGAGADLL